jgi:hypothetical protein
VFFLIEIAYDKFKIQNSNVEIVLLYREEPEKVLFNRTRNRSKDGEGRYKGVILNKNIFNGYL